MGEIEFILPARAKQPSRQVRQTLHVRKNGCRVEAPQLEHVKRLELALGIYPVVAWRLAYLVRLGRVHSELPASEVFDQVER
ncbi:hypothetical protein J5J83_08155 [Azoarcus sp. L1K30]|nr:hypothetical protein [Azoarcus sp. L1K30]